MTNVLKRSLLLTAFLLPGMVAADELMQTKDGPQFLKTQVSYTFGVVPQFQHRRILKIWRPILNEIEKRTGIKLNLTGTPTIPAFEKKFMKGDLDFAYMNPYHILVASQSPGYIPLVRDGSRRLQGILVVRKDSKIKNMIELNNKLVAFPSPNALGASMLIRADLEKRHDIKLIPKYAQTHSSVYLHVVKGLVVGGGGVMSTFKAQKPEIREKLKIIFKTRSVIPHPVTAHPRVPKHHVRKIKAAFLALGKTQEGREMLSKIPMKKIVSSFKDEYMSLADWGLDKYYTRE